MDSSINEIIPICNDITIQKSFLSKRAVYQPSGQYIKKHVFYITDADALNLSKGLANENLACTVHFKTMENGKNLMKVFMTPDGQFAAVRLYEFVPYDYVPRTEWFVFHGTSCKPLYQLVQQKSK